MGLFTITLPDIGEGIAEAELTEWAVSVGDTVSEDDVLGVVMTDKAAVEVPSSVDGKVVWLCGEPGDTIAIGARFAQIEVEGEGNDAGDSQAAAAPQPKADKPTGDDDSATAETAGRDTLPNRRRKSPRRPPLLPPGRARPSRLRAAPLLGARSRSPPLPCAGARLRLASICASSAGPAPPDVSFRRISTPIWNMVRHSARHPPACPPPDRGRSRSSACGVGSPRRWPSPRRAFRISPSSKRST